MTSLFQHTPQNLSFLERLISVGLGLGLAAAGAKPRPNKLLNIAALVIGSYFAVRGASGRCPVKSALALPAPVRGRRVARRR